MRMGLTPPLHVGANSRSFHREGHEDHKGGIDAPWRRFMSLGANNNIGWTEVVTKGIQLRLSQPRERCWSGAGPVFSGPARRAPVQHSQEPSIHLPYILALCRLSFRFSMWLGFVEAGLGLVELGFALSMLLRFNRFVVSRFAFSILPRFIPLVGLRFALSILPRFHRLVVFRFALSGPMDLSGFRVGFQPLDTPSIVLFPMPVLLPAFPVMVKLLVRNSMVLPVVPSPTLLPVISPPT